MKITKVAYEKTFNLGNYQNEKIRVEIDVVDGENPQEVIRKARDFVDLNSVAVAEKVSRMDQILANPDEYTGRELKGAKDFLAAHSAKLAEMGVGGAPVLTHESKEYKGGGEFQMPDGMDIDK